MTVTYPVSGLEDGSSASMVIIFSLQLCPRESTSTLTVRRRTIKSFKIHKTECSPLNANEWATIGLPAKRHLYGVSLMIYNRITHINALKPRMYTSVLKLIQIPLLKPTFVILWLLLLFSSPNYEYAYQCPAASFIKKWTKNLYQLVLHYLPRCPQNKIL